jgi:hypothetical protein
MSQITIQKTAYYKIIFHSFKYPTQFILGILVGTEKDGNVIIQDYLPLFHSKPLNPNLEIALFLVRKILNIRLLTFAQSEEYCAQNNMNLIGCFFSPDSTTNKSYNIPLKINEKLQTNSKSSIILMVILFDNIWNHNFVLLQLDNENLEKSTSPFQILDESGKESRRDFYSDGDKGVLKSLIVDKLHYDLHDFESHLDDIKRDWTNQNLFRNK